MDTSRQMRYTAVELELEFKLEIFLYFKNLNPARSAKGLQKLISYVK